MKRFLLGVVVGVVLYHFADKRKAKMATEDLKDAGMAVAEAGASVADAVKSAGENIADSAKAEGNTTAS